MKRIALGSLALLFAAGVANADPSVRSDRASSRFALTGSVAAVSGMSLGTLGGGLSFAMGVNENGAVVGGSMVPFTPGFSVFLWTSDGGMVNLGSLGGSAMGNDINDAGVVVGNSLDLNFNMVAFRWTQSGGMRSLGSLGCVPVPSSVMSLCSNATAVNNSGLVVGWTFTASGEKHAALWSGSTIQDLGTLGGGYSAAWDISDDGVVVGESHTASGELHAFRWTAGGGMVDLGTLGGANSAAFGVNSEGWIVGESEWSPESSERHAFLWSNGSFMDLGPAGTPSRAVRINDLAQLTGWVGSMIAPSPVAWTPTGMVALETLGGPNGRADDINGLGQVVGRSVNADGATVATAWALGAAPPPPPPPPPPAKSPQEKIVDLIAMVEGFEQQGFLNQGQANSLVKKLEAANKQLNREKGKSPAAEKILRAVTNQVHAFVLGAVLTETQGSQLDEAARDVLP